MLFFVLGIEGAFAEWCDAVTQQLVQRALGPTALIRADTLEELALNVIGSGAPHAVVSSRQAGGQLRAALAEFARNSIVALEDSRAALADLVLQRGIDIYTATQKVASGCAALADPSALPGALVLYGERDWPEEATTAAAIAQHLGLAVDNADVVDAVWQVASHAEAPRPRYDASLWWDALDPAERETAADALAPYLAKGRDPGVVPITWARELFFLGDQSGERTNGPIDITGRARCLLRGPDIMLPPGAWSASFAAFFSREAAEYSFELEICTDRQLASRIVQPEGDAATEIGLDFALDEKTDHPVSFRLHSQRATFDGVIVLVGASLTRTAPPR